jgi:transcriptional regulator with XRE-family HTH domain
VPGRLEQVLARRLREVAKEQRIALSHVADRAGLARSYFWHLLDAKSSATLDAIQRIAKALEVEPLALLTGHGHAPSAATVERPRRPRVERAAAASRGRRVTQS